MMPSLHGFALARMARVRRPGLRVIYLTGRLTPAELDADGAAKFGPVVPKTISGRELLDVVEKALKAPPEGSR
jgi:CheY-like chemotaxis protein